MPQTSSQFLEVFVPRLFEIFKKIFDYTCKSPAINNWIQDSQPKSRFRPFCIDPRRQEKAKSNREKIWFMSSMMFDDCFRVFNLFSLFSVLVSGDRARFQKTHQTAGWKRENNNVGFVTTHTILIPPKPSRIVQSLRFMLLFLSLYRTLCKHEWDENIIRRFNVGFAQIEMPSMVSVFWWLLAGQVDKITVLFTNFGRAFCKHAPRSDIFVWEFFETLRNVKEFVMKKKLRRNISSE